MDQIKDMAVLFKNAKCVYLTTYSEKSEKRIRAMTNYNEDPYTMMWFPSFRDTRKVKDIKNNPKVLITVPGIKEDEFFEIEGRAELERDEVVQKKWKWWYLSWVPDEEHNFRLSTDGPITNRVIINIYPESARIVKQT